MTVSYVPHAAQVDFHDDRFTYHFRAMFAGTGAGKTYMGAQEALSLAWAMKGSVGLICEPTYKKISEVVIPTFKQILGKDYNTIITRHDKSKSYLDICNGSRIWMIGLDKPEAAEGMNIDWAWIDEGRLVPKLKEAMASVMRRLRGTGMWTDHPDEPVPAGWTCMYVTTTPDYPGSVLNKFFEGKDKLVGSHVYRMSLMDNPTLPDHYKDNIKNIHKGGSYDRFVLGKFAAAGGAAFEYDYTARFEGMPVLCKQITDPLGTLTTIYEDGEGHIVHLEQIDSFGNTLRIVDLFYDLCSRRICEVENGNERRWKYDWEGRIIAQSANASTTRYSYDATGNLIRIIKPSGAEIHQEFDLLGRRTSLRTGDLHYTFDESIDDLKRITDARGRCTQLTLPDGSTIDYIWDAVHLRSVSRNGYSHEYLEYNDHGQPVRESLAQGWGELTRTYDACGRPTGVFHRKFSEEVLEADSAGHPLVMRYCDDRGCNTEEFSFDGLGRLLPSENEPIVLDADGRVIERGATHFVYDNLDRLTRIEGAGYAREYTYDAYGRRLTCTYSDNTGATRTTRFVHDGQIELGEMDESGSFLSLRVLGQGMAGDIGAAVAIELEGSIYVPIQDCRGCIRMLLSSYTISESYRYTSFGQAEATSWWRTDSRSHLSNPYQFSGKPTDDESGLVCFGHRYYDPQLGRWLTPDPLGYAAGPDLTAYCDGNPLSRCDPLGLAFRDAHGIFSPPTGGGGSFGGFSGGPIRNPFPQTMPRGTPQLPPPTGSSPTTSFPRTTTTTTIGTDPDTLESLHDSGRQIVDAGEAIQRYNRMAALGLLDTPFDLLQEKTSNPVFGNRHVEQLLVSGVALVGIGVMFAHGLRPFPQTGLIKCERPAIICAGGWKATHGSALEYNGASAGRAVPGPAEKGMHVIELLVAVLRIYTFVLIAVAVFSWLPAEHRDNEVYRFIKALTDPVLRPLRRILPPLGGLDLSLMAAILLTEVLRRFLLGLAR